MRSEAALLRTAKLVPWVRLGFQPRDRLFLLWGHAHLLGTGVRGQLQHVVRTAKDAVLGYERVDAYVLDQAKCEYIVRRINRAKPFGVIGYAVALDHLLRSTEHLHQVLESAGVRAVMPAAEMAPRDDSRDLLRRVFGAILVEEYGGVDFGHVAVKIGDGSFEVFSDLNILEIDESGEGSEALVTSLYPRYFPLIRYRPGDSLEGACFLDHGHVSSFARILGRTADTLVLGDGTAVHSVSVLHCVHGESSVRGAQLVLTDAGVAVHLITAGEPTQESLQRIRQRLGQLSPLLAQATIRIGPDYEVTIAGKRRWLVDRRTQPGGLP